MVEWSRKTIDGRLVFQVKIVHLRIHFVYEMRDSPKTGTVALSNCIHYAYFYTYAGYAPPQ